MMGNDTSNQVSISVNMNKEFKFSIVIAQLMKNVCLFGFCFLVGNFISDHGERFELARRIRVHPSGTGAFNFGMQSRLSRLFCY